MVLRAAVSLKTDATYVVPVAEVEYILLAATAYADTSGRFRYTQEAFSISDVASKSTTKSTADSSQVSDDTAVATAKPLAQSVSVQDTIDVLLVFIRAFADTTSLGDVDTFVLNKLATEAVDAVDADNKAHQKALSDGVAMNDDAQAGDGSAYNINKTIANVAFAGDNSSLIFAASRVESVTTADAGVLSIQDYVEFGYFAEDYVGTAQSF